MNLLQVRDDIAVAGSAVTTVVANVRIVLTGSKGVARLFRRASAVGPLSLGLSHVWLLL